MGVNPAAEEPAISCDDRQQANLARGAPAQNPMTHSRAAHPADACHSGAPARLASGYPTSAAAAREYRAQTLTRWPYRTHSSHIFGMGAALPTPPQSISVKER